MRFLISEMTLISQNGTNILYSVTADFNDAQKNGYHPEEQAAK